MAESPYSNEAFFREVDDAVRQERLEGFWVRHGRWVAGGVVAGLLLLGGGLYWDHHRREVSGEVGEKAVDLLQTAAQGGRPDARALDDLAQAGQPGYRAMALLTRAGVAAQKGDVKQAAGLYGQIAANDDLPQPYRDLATIRQVALNFEQMTPQQVVDKLKPLAVSGNPWFGSAGEMTAIAYMKMGKKNLAGPIFAAIAKDGQAPQTLRARARQMAGLLGIDAVDTDGAAANGNGEGDDAVTG